MKVHYLIAALLLACSSPVFAVPTTSTDVDGDGVNVSVDCDDNDPALGDMAYDVDCDGSLTLDDCDDNDPNVFPGNTEICDGSDNDCDGNMLGGGSGTVGSLTTTYAQGNGSSGNIFDIVALADVQVTSFDAHVTSAGAGTIDIYWKVGTGYQSTSGNAGWTFLETVSVTSNSAGQPTPVPLTTPLPLAAGQTYSIQIFSSNGIKYTDGSSVGNVIAQDSTLQITEGYGCGSLFSCSFAPRIWNGTVHYNTESSTEQDSDGDGYVECTWAGNDPLIVGGDDCDDNNPSIWPGNVELCDGLDNDCDPTTDENADNDADLESACAGDCDDNDPTIYSSATELCDGIDNNCDGSLLAGSGAAGSLTTTWAAGNGSKGNIFDVIVFNDIQITALDVHISNTTAGTVSVYWMEGTGYTSTSSGTNWTLHETVSVTGAGPSSPTPVPLTTPILLSSGQTYSIHMVSSLSVSYSNGSSVGALVAEDSNIRVTDGYGCSAAFNCPNYPRIWNGNIHYASTTVSENDNDGDGYVACAWTGNLPSILGGDDCDDNDATVWPGNVEQCDGIDNDCDPTTDENIDGDLDSESACAGDCDDTDPAINTSAVEICDGLDNDCIGGPDFDALGEVDMDQDGHFSCDDCDDSNPAVSQNIDDADCDGAQTADDCDDNDPSVGDMTNDADCDGAQTADDCDDNDPSSNILATDADCDGVLTNDDCDDFDVVFGASANDIDCDGVLTNDDCDDNDPNVGDPFYDADCDGAQTADDCDDNDPTFGAISNDADCDGTQTADDCDDNDPASYTVSVDGDCDGVLTMDDCDDNNGNLLDIANDADCDGTLTADDCDDNNPAVGQIINDADCDGATTANDCDDNDPTVGDIANDADCDGVLTVDDCDDNDPTSLTNGQDADCDGVITADDCDDNNPALGDTANDGDCDGVLSQADCDDMNSSLWYTDTAYLDADGDTYGDPVLGPQTICTGGTLPTGYVYDNSDCDDSNASLWSGLTAYPDSDFDGYGDSSNATTICGGGSPPAGYVSNNEDCDDSTSSVRPKLAETDEDGVDQNCDGFDNAWILDDFETGGPDNLLWATINGDGQTLTSSFSGAYSYALGGGGATLSSVNLDTTTCSNVIWAFYGKRGPDAPESGDLLSIDYYNGSAWVNTFTWAGDGTVDSDFGLYWSVIPDILASHQYFALEVSTSAHGVSGGDQFTIDDFVFGCDDGFDDGDGIPSLVDCEPSDPAHWSDCLTCIDLDGDDYGAGCNLGLDCDDTDSAINPDAIDPPGDGIDQDCDGRDMPTFYDDFETGDFGSGLWLQATGDVEPSSAYSDDSNASDTWSAKLGGGGGTLTTQVFDATICTRFRVSYSVKRGPEPPDSGDNLVMAYQIGTGGYTTGHTLTGNGTSDLGFTQYDHYFKMTPGLGSDVTIRFTSNGSGTANDHYFLDNVEISCGN